MSPQKVQFENKNGQGITLTAVINFPEEFDKNNKYPAIVVTHPGGGGKGANSRTVCSKTG